GQLHGRNIPRCPPQFVTCNNTGICLNHSHLCDGVNHCLDSEDELHCPTMSLTSGCGDNSVHIGEPRGIIMSMNFPHNYTNNAHCRWDIFVPAGNRVHLEFLPLFHVEMDGGNICSHDSVYIYDGDLQHLVGQFCGNTVPPPITLSSNHAIVGFSSDGSTTGTGFGLQWDTLPASGTGKSCTTTLNNSVFHFSLNQRVICVKE
ncbi:hypothetical protein BaRGS_00007306, partial [Batillaria attramentaria]